MKAHYQLKNEAELQTIIGKIADKFNATIKRLEDGNGNIILAPAKIRIIQIIEDGKIIFKVKGASNEEIAFLNVHLGEPIWISEEKISLNDFVNKLLRIPDVETKSKSDIIRIFDMDNEEYQDFFNQLERFGKRGRGPQPILDAYNILSKL